VLGDLNDFYGGPAVALLAESVEPPLAQPLAWLAPLDRYTYIFNGATQVLDHLLLTPNLAMQVAAVQIVHINADFAADAAARDPGYAVSDHDPIRVLLRPGGAAGMGGHLGVAGITVTARDTTGATVRAVSDANGDFRLWGLAPGAVDLVYAPPATATLDATQQSVTLAAGFALITPPAARHCTPAAAAWLALSGPDLVNRLLGESPAR
jgi:hypothetical protein